MKLNFNKYEWIFLVGYKNYKEITGDIIDFLEEKEK